MRKKQKNKIAIVTWFNCLRAIKLSIGAWLQGYELELITKYQGLTLVRELNFDHIYSAIKIWETPSQLERHLRDSNADVFWCHNEPDLMTELSIGLHKGKRFIMHDCHDLPTLHPKEKERFEHQEKIAIEGSDVTFVPTPAYLPIIKEKYNKDATVTLSCAPGIFFHSNDLPRVNGMLYCGQVNVPEMNSKLHYRNVLPLFQYMTNLGIPTHIYNTTPNINLIQYTMAGACTYGCMRMYAAIHQYTRYDYGFVGSNVNCEEIQLCMPNKLFDCIAAGIPLVCLNSDVAGKFCENLGIGINVQELENMALVPWKDSALWEEKREKVREIRNEYTAENEIKKAFTRVGI